MCPEVILWQGCLNTEEAKHIYDDLAEFNLDDREKMLIAIKKLTKKRSLGYNFYLKSREPL